MNSRHIGQKAAQTIYHSFEQAVRIGLPLNTFVTINFSLTTCPPEKAVKCFRLIRRDKHGKWAKRHPKLPHAATGAYVFENAREQEVFETMNEGDPHNLHCHWALHVPRQLSDEFEMAVHSWLEAMNEQPIDENAIKITTPPQHRQRGYMLKGTDKKWAETYKAIASSQGLVVGGRRSGTTINIGRSERISADRQLGIRRRIPTKPVYKTM